MGDGLSHRLTLRPAIADDARFIYELRNEAGVREASFNSEPLDWDRHLAWFTSKLAEGARIYIAVSGERPAGYARLDSAQDGECEISIAILPELRGQGIGTEVIRLASEMAEREGFVRLVARIKPGNEASRRAFDSVGYRGAPSADGTEIVLRRPAVA